jgi:hypothetical protein
LTVDKVFLRSDLQEKGIAAIPHVDALICEHKDRDIVCEAIGRQIFLVTGVWSIVGGVRYLPLREEEQQAARF